MTGVLARPGRQAQRRLLSRLRRLFTIFTVVVCLLGASQITTVEPGQRLTAAGAYLALVAWALLTDRAQGRWWWVDGLLLVAAGALGLVVEEWIALYPLVHVALFQRALYGGALRVYGGAVVLTVAWAVGGTFGDLGALVDPIVPGLVVGAVLSSWLLRQVRLLAERAERGSRREGRLLQASQDLLAATDEDAVDQTVAEAALDLVGQPGARAVLWEDQGEHWLAVASAGPARVHAVSKIRLPDAMVGRAALGEPWVLDADEAARLQSSFRLDPRFAGYVYVPVPRTEGPAAVLSVSCPQTPDEDLPDVLRRFVHVVTLAEDRARLLARVADRESRLTNVLQSCSDVIAMLDEDGTFTFINRATTALHGFAPEDLVGRNVFHLIHPEDHGQVMATLAEGDLREGVQIQCRLFDASGEVRHVETNLTQPEGEERGYVLNVRDVTDRKALEAEIVHHAHHDALTGLANRRWFTHRLEEALARAERHEGSVGLIMLDLDGFKPVNDTYGHQAGDEALIEIGQRLQAEVRSADVAARIGGDEFAVVIDLVDDPEEVAALAGRLERAIERPIELERGGTCVVASSTGVARSHQGTTADELLWEADRALYESKRAREGSGHVLAAGRPPAGEAPTGGARR